MTPKEHGDRIAAARAACRDAVEKARADGVSDSADLARLDAELVRLVVRFVDDLAGSEFRRVLVRASMGAAPGEKCPDSGPDTRRGAALMLAQFVTDMAPIIGRGMTERVVKAQGGPERAAHVLARDLQQLGTENGATPVLLPAPARGKGHGDHRDLKRAARRRLVLLVYDEAGRTRETLQAVKARIVSTVEEKTWERMRGAVSANERDAAKAEGARRGTPHPDLAPETLSKLYEQALR